MSGVETPVLLRHREAEQVPGPDPRGRSIYSI